MVTFLSVQNNSISFNTNMDYYKYLFKLDIGTISLQERIKCLKIIESLKIKKEHIPNIYIPYCNLYIFNNILDFEKHIYLIESLLFTHAIVINNDNPNITYYKYMHDIKNVSIKKLLSKFRKNKTKEIKIKTFEENTLQKQLCIIKRDLIYHDEIASLIAFDYYSSFIDSNYLKYFDDFLNIYRKFYFKNMILVNSIENKTLLHMQVFFNNTNKEITDNILKYESNNDDSEILEDSNQNSINTSLCSICYSNKVNVFYEKCNHIPICLECSYKSFEMNLKNNKESKFPKCPICRTVNHKLKLVYVN